jgi:hypothetical protein
MRKMMMGRAGAIAEAWHGMAGQLTNSSLSGMIEHGQRTAK